jgi:hypothetical protein
MKLISRTSPPQFGHASGNSSPTRAISFAQAIREVSCVQDATTWSGSCWQRVVRRTTAKLSGVPSPRPSPRERGGKGRLPIEWRSRPAATGDSVQTHRYSDAGAFGAVESAPPADTKTQTGSGRQHHSSRAPLTSVYGPAQPSRPACAWAGHSEPAQDGRPCSARPRVTPAQTPAGHSIAAGAPSCTVSYSKRRSKPDCLLLGPLSGPVLREDRAFGRPCFELRSTSFHPPWATTKFLFIR